MALVPQPNTESLPSHISREPVTYLRNSHKYHASYKQLTERAAKKADGN